MSTWTKFYIETENLNIVVDQLKELTNIRDTTIGEYPEDIYDNYLFDVTAKPTYLSVGSTTANWITISHNSFSNLSEWGTTISKKLDTRVIITSAQSVSDYYYFSLYDKGKKIREIEVCYSEDFKPKNFGKPFDFENEQPGKKEEYDGEIEYYFGFEEIEDYCKHFNLEIQTDYNRVECTILKTGIKEMTINDFVNNELKKENNEQKKIKKPWWKFW